MQDAQRKYLRNFGIAMLGYCITLIIAVTIAERIESSTAKVVIILTPIVPILFGMRAFIEMIRALDELQRKIHFEAFAFSMGVTGIITFTSGLVESQGFDTFGVIWVFPMLIAFWGVGLSIARRRYE